MQTTFYRIIAQTEPVTITKQDGTATQKSTIVLQQLGGKYEDSFAATMLGSQVKFSPNDLVVANIRCSSREYNSQYYQDCIINEIRKLS